MIDAANMKPVQITCAWQECHDENSGYPYYWNMTTNEVTWEMPAEYQLALQKWQLLQQQQLNSKKAETSLSNSSASISEKLEACKNKLSNNQKESALPKKKYPFDSDSEEDEKIELITSYGSDSSDSSDSESSPKSKSTKETSKVNSSKNKSIVPQISKSHSKEEAQTKFPSSYGPCFPPGATVNTSNPSKAVEKLDGKKGKSISLVPYGDPDTTVNSESSVSNLNSDSTAVDHNSSDETKVSGSESATAEIRSDEEESDEEEFDEDESLILSKLRSQAMVLKQLGGEIPDEIKCLIDSENPDIGIDDIIALIENETPPDHATNSDCDKSSSKSPSTDEKGSKTVEEVNSPKSVLEGSNPEFSKANQPSSFALIAGYGDDSDQEESSSPPKSTGSGTGAVKRKALFPIDEKPNKSPVPSKLEISSKPAFKKIKLSARAKALINASIITAKARATPSIPLSEENTSDVKSDVAACPAPAKEEVPVDSLPVKDPVTVNQGASSPTVVKEEIKPAPSEKEVKEEKKIQEVTKKNIAVPTVVPVNGIGAIQASSEVKPSTSSLATSSKSFKPALSTVSSQSNCYTSVWDSATTYAVDEKRGFGFSDDLKPAPPTSSSFYRSKSEKKTANIQFIKAETINVNPPAPVPVVIPEIVKADDASKTEIESLSEVIIEKVRFLSEGKEPVSPVQIMAIQVETLMNAWQASCLSGKYLLNWLNETSKQLSSLEKEAAPGGWKCEWDRSFNRYYYRNLETGRIQWEYPLPLANENEETIEEVEMELCETPPPPSSPLPQPPATPPPPSEEPPLPKTPPPPVISFSPPPPPVISGFKSSVKKTVNKKKSKSENLSIELPPLPENPPLPKNPPPPPPADAPPPPLPPLPPSDPKSISAPLPPSSAVGTNQTQRILKEFNQNNAQIFAGQQLPPPPPSYPPPSPQQRTSESLKPALPATQRPMFPSVCVSAPRSLTNKVPDKISHQVIETPAYSVQPAQPPLPPSVTDLNSALDSFYSDIASLEANVPEETSKSEPSAPSSGHIGASAPLPGPTPAETESPSLPKKKKKVKLAAGLTLKKKGLDSLVAKWEKVHKSVCD
nr:PREDICTED: formin-binding protein 4-like [Bemisia tabaci]